MVPILALAASPSGPAPAQEKKKIDHPRLRAALHELREARNYLKDAPDNWPPGYKEHTLQSLNDSIATVRTILAVKDVDTFRGVDRNPDYYKKYKDHPRLRAALEDIRDARDELRSSPSDFGGLKEHALDDFDVAAGNIVGLIRFWKK
jgi:hypothetical protein